MKKTPRFSLPSFTRTSKPDHRLTAVTLLIFTVLSLALLLVSARTPIHNGTVQSESGQTADFSFPFRDRSGSAGMQTLSFNMKLSALHPTSFFFQADDCLESIEVNGTPVFTPGLPHCDYAAGRTIDLSDFVQRGSNEFVVNVRNHGGDASLQFNASWTDTTIITLAAIFLAFTLAISVVILKKLRVAPYVYTVFLIVFAGIALRTYYTITTDYWVRGHDTDGHIEYIRYIEEHVELPPPNEGWEYWQPPLYYVTSASWMRLLSYADVADETILRSLQFVALLASILTLLIIVETGLLLFEKRDRPFALPLFVSIASFFPGLIYMSARINNDVLVTLLSFVAFGLLVLWWKKPRMKTWIALALAISLGILTKNTALLLLPVAGLSMLCARGIPWKKKIVLGVMMLTIVAVTAGWFSLWRMHYDESQSLIVGNENTLNSGLAVPNNPSAYLIFNPIEMIKRPFNNPWGDEERRQYFWEYLYRSAFTGEFMPGVSRMQVGSWLLFWSFLLMIPGLYGLYKTVRMRFHDSLPLLFLCAILLAGHAVFRYRFPFSSSQDFRYSLLLIFPYAYFASVGLLHLTNPLMRRIGIIVAELFVVFCAISLIGL